MTLLAVSHISAAYGASQALFGVSLRVAAGEVVALMGRNGMGKSTTVRCICRMMPFQGTISFDSVDIGHLPSHRAARLGIGLVPEGRRCFAHLTVTENLVAPARPGYWDLARVTALFPRLGERKHQKASLLSGGEQQLLAIGRALMTNPRLLILDEATEGLAPMIRREIWAVIRKLRTESGLAILIIDKSVKELRGVCDQAVILERGRSVWQGPMGDLSADITEKYVGV